MLSFTGNTLTYIMYSYVRICSIVKKALAYVTIEDTYINPDELNDNDMALMKYLVRFNEVILKAIDDNMIHQICQYLYEIANVGNVLLKNERCLHFDNDKINKIYTDRVKLFCILKNIYETCFGIIGVKPIEII